jgi:hypothetical protein
MWPSCAHILTLLTDQFVLKKKAHIKLTDEMQKAFDKMRLLMAANALAVYPDHNKWFNMYIDILTSSWAHVLSKKEGRLPTSCKR